MKFWKKLFFIYICIFQRVGEGPLLHIKFHSHSARNQSCRHKHHHMIMNVPIFLIQTPFLQSPLFLSSFPAPLINPIQLNTHICTYILRERERETNQMQHKLKVEPRKLFPMKIFRPSHTNGRSIWISNLVAS